MLFTGAGFSLGAHNGSSRELPTGNVLKRRILTELLELNESSDSFLQLKNEKLSDVINYCNDAVGENKVHDFLTEEFKNCTPMEYHKTIANFHWDRVYTTNIDDVWENATNPGQYIVQNMHRLQSNSRGKDKPHYYKLHGCVRNPNGDYIFSTDDYTNEVVAHDSSPMHSYILDIQTNNFVFVGFDDNELDINVYLKQYSWRTGTNPGAKLFFVNPSPTIMFENKVKKVHGIIIRKTTEQFAEIIASFVKSDSSQKSTNLTEIRGFNLINAITKHLIGKDEQKSQLLHGNFPTWNDIYFNWDFRHQIVKRVINQISSTTSSNQNSCIVVSLFGKMLIGKSVFLKRIGFELLRDDYMVYEIARRDFDLEYFLNQCSRQPSKKYSLLVDNAPFFYSSIARLIDRFPSDKHIVVVTAGRSYYHRKQVYALRQHPYYFEYSVDPFSDNYRVEFAKEIDRKLKEKGFLGYLQNKTEEDRLKEIMKYGDTCSLLYSLTDSFIFRSKFTAFFQDAIVKNQSLQMNKDVLLALAIFQELDIPSFPLDILVLWKRGFYTHVMNVINDYVRFIDSDSIALRNSFLKHTIFTNSSEKDKVSTISIILKLISPQKPAYGRNMWSMMQEKLMGYRTLTKLFKISKDDVSKLYSSILTFYNSDYNYWIQVGIADQEEHDYKSAHNHLMQAENLNSQSYLVRHAIARNYLLRSLSTDETNMSEINYNKGKALMLKLIDEKEGDQTKAYSIHSYVNYSVKYWRKYDITPSQSEIKQMMHLLKTLNANNQNDVKTASAEQSLFKYLREKGLTRGVSFNWNELNLLKEALSNEGVNPDDLISDEIPE